MPIWEMTVNLPAEKAYQAILEYVKAGSITKSDKVERSSKPSYIEFKNGAGSILIKCI